MIRRKHAIGGQWARSGELPLIRPTIFGFDTNETDSLLSKRLGWWNGRAPCVRRYNSAFIGTSFPITTAVAPEKRVSYSFKADGSGSFTKAGLAAGNGNDRLTGWCESIPANWTVWLTYYHEPNDDFRNGSLTIANFRDAYEQFRTAIDAATLQSGVRVFLASCFMSYRVAETPAYFSDTWVPPLGVADLMTFDIYGNPGHYTTQKTGPGYGTTYPAVATRFRDTFAAVERNGFAAHWGVLEMNTPGRDWDTTPKGESQRAKWLVEATELCLHPPMAGSVPPEIFLYWEAPSGVNWDQSFGRVGGNPRTCADAIAPYILGTPVGG